MPSPTESLRHRLEQGLRTVAFAALLGLLVVAVRPPVGTGNDRSDSAGLAAALVRWSTVESPSAMNIHFTAPPRGTERDWLRALASSGARLTWSSDSLIPIAVQYEPRADPRGGADLTLLGPSPSQASLRDTIGTLDSLTVTRPVTTIGIAAAPPILEVAIGPSVASAVRLDSLALGRLLLLGRAGWEFKFTAAALEEQGWQLDARAVVSPRSTITQSAATIIDTARYAAVIVLDSSAFPSARLLAAYIRSGGGVLLWPEAARLPVLAALSPGRPGTLTRSDRNAIGDSLPRAGLEHFPIADLDSTAVVLERQGTEVSIAAKRTGPGRVILLGYRDLWRWRMAGTDSSLAGHRQWLSALVSRVAYERPIALPHGPSNVAPLATLLDALGPPSSGAAPGAGGWTRLLPWLFATGLLVLLAEWLSRRLRGAR